MNRAPSRPRGIAGRLLAARGGRLLLLSIVLATLLAAGGCDSPLTPGSASVSASLEERGRADVTGTRSIAPPPEGEPVEYRVDGSGPEGEAFTRTAASMPLDLSGLVPGTWSIRVHALDAGGTLVLEGEATALVSEGVTTPVPVTLAPPAGDGAVDLAVSWPAAQVGAPELVAELHRDGHDPRLLDAAVDAAAGTATVAATGVPAGWYRLQLRLSDGGALVAGHAALLRVRAGVTTRASLVMDDLNKPGAAVAVTGSSFTLAWDAPADVDPADPLASYNVYYRAHGTWPWTLLGSAGAGVESYVVDTAELDHGVYDFAVTSVTESGAESEPHTSLDDDATPATGWYVDWRP